jgi:glutaredoxin
MLRSRLLPLLFSLALAACGSRAASPEPSAASGDDPGEVVAAPFSVRGSAEGLLLTWFDEEGAHNAASRSEVPAERRGEVRVDSLDVAPEDRDPDHVFVADLRTADEHGDYTVRRMTRDAFEARVQGFVTAARGETATASTGADVIIYGAEWCHACSEAQAFLRARNIPFVERDIERDAGAREEMARRAAQAGIPSTSIPIIDFRGTMIQGFDRSAIERAIRETSPDQAPGITI